jgi:uncharacterized lipoprotein YddW (UPF0748 family)
MPLLPVIAHAPPARLRSVCLWLSCALALAIAVPGAAPGATGREQDVRALWVTRATLGSPDAVARMVASAQAGGFNTLLVQVRGRGDAYYRSTLEPRAPELASHPGFDPLGATIAQAHAAGLRVHAWVAVNLVSSAATLPSSREHLVYKNPEWLMVPRELAVELRTIDARSPEYLGRLARWSRQHAEDVEGLYASPLHAGAASHITAVVRELAAQYEVDGIHLDYVRYPGEEFDYSRLALQQFKESVLPDMTAAERRTLAAREALDPLAYPNFYPERWKAFRRSRLTSLVMRVRTAAKDARPGILVSAAVVPDAAEAFQARLQDWRTWLDQSLIDVVCPMAYTPDPKQFESQVAMAQDYSAGRPVWAGIGAYRLPSAATLQFIATSRRLGVQGVILFSYDALIAPPYTATTLTDIGRAAFGSGSH